MKLIKPLTFAEVLERARNAPPLTPEQQAKAQEIIRQLGPGFIALTVPRKKVRKQRG